MNIRVGQGVDVHPFSDDPRRPFVLGGVTLPGVPGLRGHSDGDPLLHALTDAVLGAAALGDLGVFYGTEDPAAADASSRIFLLDALTRAGTAGWSLSSVDVTLVAQRPRLAPYRELLVDSLTGLLGLAPSAVGLKATTTDHLGFVGRGEGVACLAIAVLVASASPAAGLADRPG